ncbi:MAG: hypothetical protein H6917_12965 [Novosphingobium sp.]|nr:hypothetical protein [Novosphingobium sp.]MCP5403281.1 hypothetical protein [Novosphingobium sp.]
MRSAIVLASVAALAACGPGENDPGPGGVTVGEARALDEAAEMIEQRRLPPEALPAPDVLPSDIATDAPPR